VPGEKRRLYCKDCKLEGMVNLAIMKQKWIKDSSTDNQTRIKKGKRSNSWQGHLHPIRSCGYRRHYTDREFTNYYDVRLSNVHNNKEKNSSIGLCKKIFNNNQNGFTSETTNPILTGSITFLSLNPMVVSKTLNKHKISPRLKESTMDNEHLNTLKYQKNNLNIFSSYHVQMKTCYDKKLTLYSDYTDSNCYYTRANASYNGFKGVSSTFDTLENQPNFPHEPNNTLKFLLKEKKDRSHPRFQKRICFSDIHNTLYPNKSPEYQHKNLSALSTIDNSVAHRMSNCSENTDIHGRHCNNPSCNKSLGTSNENEFSIKNLLLK
jgi:hypothetical protein